MNIAISRCRACRHHALNSFVALAGIPIQTFMRNTFPSKAQQHTPRRLLRASARLRDTWQAESETANPAFEVKPLPQLKKQDPSIPWYLQVETPTPPAPSLPHLAHQEIPAIPADAPEILSPMLVQLSDHIGLDHLTLIDLRHLDPPPALGANLIMIIGTARSYRHLNTSADRFCRWLRSRYKLAPYADGLLGRNELKLKLRRKARKMKLAQSVGNTVAASETDDGITTGWICVNVGSVDDAKMPMVAEQQEHQNRNNDIESSDSVSSASTDMAPGERLTSAQQEEMEDDEQEYENPDVETNTEGSHATYVGFGSRSTAPKIVVQMFTEEKRLEMDLEGLWDYRQEKRAQKDVRSDAEARRNLGRAVDQDTTNPETSFKPWTQ